MSKYPIVGVVLCGGLGSRMGGVDKGLVTFKDRYLVEYAIDALSSCETIIINANRNKDDYKALFDCPVVKDSYEGFLGPLAGMLSALLYAKQHAYDWVITVPCDTPFIGHDFVKKMMSYQFNNQGSLIYYAVDSDYNQPVFSLLSTALIPSLQNFLTNEGSKKILKFYTNHPNQTVFFEDNKQFDNLNRESDLFKY